MDTSSLYLLPAAQEIYSTLSTPGRTPMWNCY
jgi:hypothetical protein